MICAIHQPQYLPWLGYFEKIHRSDVFILLDNVQFKKNEWQNRNKICTPNPPGWQWLTVPVLHDFGQNINEVQLNPAVAWAGEHVRAIEMNYARAPYFKEIWPALRPLYDATWPNLAALNSAFVQKIVAILGIKTRLVTASSLAVSTTKTERLVDLCRAVGCDTYLAGAGCAEYMDFELFKASGITVEVQLYTHPVYPQVWAHTPEAFMPHMSVIDLLFNAGKDSLKILAERA
ncbi:MAG: WbqC family protein [Candidatus Omnitrophica bacterium]|nr:WbqC family protein [Candidatus Omnitrophota bacterium]